MTALVNAVAKLVVDIVGDRIGITSAGIKNVAEEIVKQWINYGIKITVQAIEEFITKEQPAYNKSKDVVYEMLESAKATAGFVGRLFESVVPFGVDCLRYAVGNINGQELIRRTRRRSVDDNIMHPSAKPLVGAAAGAVTGAAIGSAIPGVGTVIGGLVGAYVGSYAGVVVARNT